MHKEKPVNQEKRDIKIVFQLHNTGLDQDLFIRCYVFATELQIQVPTVAM